jgi:acyl carrier protein
MPSYEEALRATTDILRTHVKGVDRPIQPTDNILNDLGLDSLAVMELVAEVEDRFHVEIPSATLDRLVTVEDVARALVELKKSA